MTGRDRITLSREACARVSAAVRTAEGRTSGEIVVVVAARAGLYRSAPLLLALGLGLAVPWPLIALTPWSAASIALAQALCALAILLLGLHPGLRLALVPRAIRRSRAHEAGRREFYARGLTATRGRTGVLIYLALAEGHAEIIADRAVVDRVPAETWEGVIAPLLQSLRRGEMEAGLVTAVERVGAILTVELPQTGEPIDELPNRVVVIA